MSSSDTLHANILHKGELTVKEANTHVSFRNPGKDAEIWIKCIKQNIQALHRSLEHSAFVSNKTLILEKNILPQGVKHPV